MPRLLIRDVHEWINETLTVPIYHLANSLSRERARRAEKGFRRTLLEPELVDPHLEINFVNDAGAAVKSCNVNS